MIMIRLMGGLGNQMFQYAFGRSLAIKHQTELVLDDSFLKDKSNSHEVFTHRDFELDIFSNLNYRWATSKEVFAFNGNKNSGVLKRIFRKVLNQFNSKELIIQLNNEVANYVSISRNNSCYVGRWQSYKFFEDYLGEIRNEFVMNRPQINGIDDLMTQINGGESVCVHFRRGDLVTSPLYSETIGSLDLDYYVHSISHINKSVNQPNYFVFSDDIEWCKQNLNLNEKAIFIEAALSGKKSEGHFYLMQHCKHFIISNSTFAWWAAYLSSATENKQVIYPKNWYKKAELQNPYMCPNNWIGN